MQQPTKTEAAEGRHDLVRLPGLFRRWEIAEVIQPGCEFQVEEAGTASDGTELFAVYRREPNTEEQGNDAR